MERNGLHSSDDETGVEGRDTAEGLSPSGREEKMAMAWSAVAFTKYIESVPRFSVYRCAKDSTGGHCNSSYRNKLWSKKDLEARYLFVCYRGYHLQSCKQSCLLPFLSSYNVHTLFSWLSVNEDSKYARADKVGIAHLPPMHIDPELFPKAKNKTILPKKNGTLYSYSSYIQTEITNQELQCPLLHWSRRHCGR